MDIALSREGDLTLSEASARGERGARRGSHSKRRPKEQPTRRFGRRQSRPKVCPGRTSPWQGPRPGGWPLEHGSASIHPAVLLGGIPAGRGRIPGAPGRLRVQGFYPDQPPALTSRTHASSVLLSLRSLGINRHRRRATGLLLPQGPTLRELGLSYPVREKAEMPDALEPTRQNVEQE